MRYRSRWSRPSLRRLSSKAASAAPDLWAPLSSLVVMNRSSRAMSLFAIARPTPSSLRYIAAVSIDRYPASRAVVTTRSTSSGGTWKTPKPSCGMVAPVFRASVGISVMGWVASFEWPLAFLPDRAVPVASRAVGLVIARCSGDYVGRLTAHLPLATRLLVIKADGSVLVHSDGGSYKPLNWMSPPCTLAEGEGVWTVTNKAGEQLIITFDGVEHDSSHELGVDPGLVKDGVEAHLQKLLAEHIHTLGDGYRLVRREYPTPIGPVDILARDPAGAAVAVEIKRRGEIDGVEQLTRYLELLNRDPLLAPVRGVFAAQEIKPQARTLAEDRGIACLVLDYDALRGIDDPSQRLF